MFNTTIKHFKKGDYVKVLRTNEIGIVLRCSKGIHSDLIFAITPTLKKQIVKTQKLSSTKVKVVCNGVDINIFSNIKQNKTYDLIFIGSPSPYRDLYRLFEAYSYIIDVMPNTRFVYVGWENTEYTRGVHEYANKLKILNNIEFIPKIPQDKIPNMLAEAKVGVISLVDEKIFKSAVGAKTYEYLSAGLPLACLGPSFDCELKKLIKDNRVGTYESDPKEFAEAVICLLNNVEVRKNMSENASKTIHKFDFKTIIHKAYIRYLLEKFNNDLITKEQFAYGDKKRKKLYQL